MQRYKKTLLLILLFTINSQADMNPSKIEALKNQIIQNNIPNCLNVTNHYDRVYCSGKIYNILDNKLNNNYKTLRKKLTISQKNTLKKIQTKWIHKRDNQCAKISNRGVVINLTCSIQLTMNSLYAIKNMIKYPKDINFLLKEYKKEL